MIIRLTPDNNIQEFVKDSVKQKLCISRILKTVLLTFLSPHYKQLHSPAHDDLLWDLYTEFELVHQSR